MTEDEFQVYKEWPVEQVRQAFEEFRDQMYDGAGPEELSAGLLCMDFLTRRTDLPETLAFFIENVCDQARIRIALMRAKEQDDLEESERMKRMELGVYVVTKQLEAIQKRIRGSLDPETTRRYVEKKVRERHE